MVSPLTPISVVVDQLVSKKAIHPRSCSVFYSALSALFLTLLAWLLCFPPACLLCFYQEFGDADSMRSQNKNFSTIQTPNVGFVVATYIYYQTQLWFAELRSVGYRTRTYGMRATTEPITRAPYLPHPTFWQLPPKVPMISTGKSLD
jgi:hypothetical protein